MVLCVLLSFTCVINSSSYKLHYLNELDKFCFVGSSSFFCPSNSFSTCSKTSLMLLTFLRRRSIFFLESFIRVEYWKQHEIISANISMNIKILTTPKKPSMIYARPCVETMYCIICRHKHIHMIFIHPLNNKMRDKCG